MPKSRASNRHWTGLDLNLKKKRKPKGLSRHEAPEAAQGAQALCSAARNLRLQLFDCKRNISESLFRMKSLKQGQSRSLLTPAARHHAAQSSFLRKALKSLESLEPHVKVVAEEQHIDYQFSGLEDDDDGNDDYDDDEDEDDDAEVGSESEDDSELIQGF